jgi:hypothetical protein
MLFVFSKIDKWTQFNGFEARIFPTLDVISTFVMDESDPGVDIPNIVHAF